VSPITDDDLDRLADYAAGLLDPAEEAEVDRLIATDAHWARAHAALTSAQPLLDRALGGLPVESMPPDVAARLDRALEREASAAGTRSNVIDLGRARRWRRAALATTAVAAAAAACVGGLVALNGPIGTSNSGSTAPRGDKAAAPEAGQGFAAAPPTQASGTDYTHDLLSRPLGLLSGRAPNAAGAPGSAGQPRAADAQDHAGVPSELVRLTDPAQLRTCLDAIVADQGGRVTGVDYARYRGTPALIVTLIGGRATALAAGADCGLAGAGPAVLDTAP
jgi:hypothetical protein